MELRELVDQLARERNLDLRGYKSSSLERRVRHRMFQVKIVDFGAYARYIAAHPEEVNQLLNAVLINVTRFFRDPPMWEALRERILPELTRDLRPGDSFRAWSAGCASGEETYSLCILLAEHFGERLRDYEVKVYGTDIDEEALVTARRAEYPADTLEFVPRHLRDKHFSPGPIRRLSRETRRMAIFGRNNLVSDAPISHVKLMLCRNVLIYFDAGLQKGILERLHYALDPDGILVLGKAESQWTRSALFQMIDAKARIFRRLPTETPRGMLPQEKPLARARPDPSSPLQLYYDSLLQTLGSGVIVVDEQGKIVSCNEAMLKLWGIGEELQGRKLAETSLAERCPALLARIKDLNGAAGRIEVNCPPSDDAKEGRTLAITVTPVRDDKGKRIGSVIHSEDITPHSKLQTTVHDLVNTGEELQSANAELETTNEELQSTNEELETTNEELQSTNEELETTNEELQALNEELGTTNEELEARTRELDALNERYLETLERLPWPVLLIDGREVLQFWNTAAARMFGLEAKSVVGLALHQLPLQQSLRNVLTRWYREAMVARRPRRPHGVAIDVDAFRGKLDLQFIPLAYGSSHQSVLIVLEPPGAELTGLRKANAARKVASRKAATRKAAGSRNRKSRRK